MVDGKDIKLQINEQHKLLEELKAKKIELVEQFVAKVLIEELSSKVEVEAIIKTQVEVVGQSYQSHYH